MMRQIREMTDERMRQNDILQGKVGEATAELVQKNEQLENANLELFRTTRKMSEMERLAAAGQTAAEFAHEVGTPLNLISGHVQLLQTNSPCKLNCLFKSRDVPSASAPPVTKPFSLCLPFIK